MATAVELVRQFRQMRVLVIGDAMLDTYLEGTAARLCSEGPVPVVRKTSELRSPGGAANTAANLRALDAQVHFLGITGCDIAGELLRKALREREVADTWLVEDPVASTLHKMRILADSQYVVRFDDEESHSYVPETHARLLTLLEELYAQCDVVVISDYKYGVLSEALIERLKELRAAEPKPLVIDSKDLLKFRTSKATVVTPNRLEARLLVEHGKSSGTSLSAKDGLADVEQIARQLLEMIDTEYAAITLAADGVFLMNQEGKTSHLPAHPVPQANDVGAGDSFTSALSLALAAGAPVEEAAQIGIDAAAIAISKRGTSVVTHQELLQRASLRDHVWQGGSILPATERTQALARLLEILERERATGRTIVFTNGVFDILHAGHVHFLRQAKALGDILVVGVNSDESTRRLKGKNRPINSERDRMALVAALDPVDHVLLFDEDTPTELIRMLRPHVHVKGGDYADEELPEAEAVREGGGQIVIVPLAGSHSTSSVIDRIVALARHPEQGVEA